MKRRNSQLPDFFSALGHPNRISIVDELRAGEICQCELPALLGLEQSNLSRHLKILSDAGVVNTRRDGTRIMLSVDPQVFELLDSIKSLLRSRLSVQFAELQ